MILHGELWLIDREMNLKDRQLFFRLIMFIPQNTAEGGWNPGTQRKLERPPSKVLPFFGANKYDVYKS